MRFRKILSLLLAMTMLFSCVGITAMAGGEIIAKVGDATYTSFAEAIKAANAMTGDVTVEIYGAVEFTNGMEINGNYGSIAFVGKDENAVVTINQSAGGDYLEAHGKTVAFTDLNLAKANPAWSGNSGHMGNYFSVQGGTVTYTNCTFPNGACTNTGTATYVGCTFENTSEYGLWVYDDAYVTVEGGTINSKKGIKVYSEGEDSVTSTLTVENATFTDNITSKPAVAIGYAESITLIGNTYSNTTGVLELDSGSDADCEGVTFVAQDAEGNDITSTLTAVDRSNGNAACGVLVDEKIYTTVKTAVAEATSGSTVTLLYSTDETATFAEGVTLTLADGVEAENVTVKTTISTIATVEDLIAFANAVNSGDDYAGKTVTMTADLTLTDAWTSIGNGSRSGSSYTGKSFAGTFNGGNYTISGLTAPLFGIVTGTVKDVNLVANINDTTNDSVGAAVAVLVGGTVDDVDVSGTITAAEAAGGVVGRVLAIGEVKNSDNTAAVTSTGSSDAAGGIVGKAYYTSTSGVMNITDCTNKGAINGGYAAGGIVGFSAANVSNCTNDGTVNSTGIEAGGIVGEQTNYGTISGNENSVNVTGGIAGGIVGWVRYQNNSSAYPLTETVAITNNTNTGSIASTTDLNALSCAGGIVGNIYNQATVTDNTNKAATISAATFAAGIVGALQPASNNVDIEGATFTVTNNISTTTAANITANCTALDAYNNVGSDATIKDNTVPSNVTPCGTNSYAYTKEVDGYVRVWGQSENTNAAESFVLKLYSDDTLIATTVLNNIDNIIDGSQDSITWNFFYPESNDEYWTTKWEEGHPNSAAQPTKVELYIDGTLVATTDAKMSGADDLNPVVWRNLGGVAVADLAGAGTEEDPYLINNLAELKWFRDDVNSGNTYAGKYVELTSDIDLNDEEWTPIAYNGKTFKGNFNGGNKTVKNLKITKELINTSVNNGIGFFGRTDSPATICNLTIENVDITGSLQVGAVVGYGYTGKKIENCTVKGNITIDAWWYAGGIGGNGYMDLVNNCHVIGNTGSYIKGNDGSYIGGIWGFRGENGHKITNCTVSGISITGVDRVGGISGIAHYGNVISNCSATNVTIKATDPDATTVGLIVGACQGTESEPSVFEDNIVENVTATVGDTVITDLYGTRIDGTVPVTNFVAEVSGVQYESLTDAIAAAKAGDTIKLLADAHIAEGTDVTLPAGITLNGNGFSIFASGADHDTTTSYGYVIAGGNLTIEGITKIEKFSAGYYDRTITIGEGASLDVFGKNRVTLAYGNVFNITGTISDAKTADKAETLASLIIPAGISITGANDAAMNVKNAYVSIGSTTTKNSSTSGTIKLNFENSIAEFTNQLTFSEPTNGMNPTFNVNVKDSVLTTATKLCIAAPNTTMVVDNSTVNLGSYIRNSGELTLKNGSTLTGSTIQFGENGGNDGTIIVDRSVLTVNASSEGHAFDGKGRGLVVVKNGSTATITYLKDGYYDVDSTSTLNATLIGCTEYKVSVAKIGETEYTSLQKALDAAAASTGNVTVEILSDINLTGIDWNPVTVSAPGYPVVTVNGNNKTITGLNDMLFAGTWAGGSGLIINDLTIKDSTIENDVDDTSGTTGVGAFIGYPQASAVITLNNCHLVDSTVKGGHWTGGLIGIAGGYNGTDGPVFMNLTIEDCSVTGSTITGKGSAGGISGHAANNAWTNVVIENTTVSGNTITSTGSSVNKAGAVMGTIGVAGQPTTTNGETKTGGVSVSATVSDNAVNSGGTTITTIYGRQGSTGGVLTITGGTYENNPIEENVSYAKPAEGYEIVKNENGTYGLVEKVEPFDFYGSNILLGSSLEMNFYVEKSNLDGTDYYAEVKHYDENNNVSTTQIPYSSWVPSGSGYLYINYDKLVARQMSDKIEVAIFKNDGTRVSVVREDGIRANALRILSNEKYKNNPDGILTTVVDMLNYGAAAQIYFEYNEENLANAGIDDYQIHATKEDVELEDIRVKDDNKCYGTNLSLRNNIVLTGYFKEITESMHANVKFVDHNGNDYDYDIPYNEFVPNGSYHEVRVDQLAIADANVTVTVTIYDGDKAYTTLIESMNSVLYKNKVADSSNGIYQQIANFASSAQKYLDAQ